MWVNPAYLPEDPLAVAKALVERHPLAVLIAEQPLLIAHMPVLWRAGADGRPVIVGHVPVADPISRPIATGASLTIVFPGPSGYVTPNWYGSEGLPTYNYAPVHVRGRPARLDEAGLREHLFDLVRDHEERHSPDPRPWRFDAAARRRFERLLPKVIGFALPIDDLQVKVKLGQNRPAADNETVMAKLAQGESDQRWLSERMRDAASPRRPR